MRSPARPSASPPTPAAIAAHLIAVPSNAGYPGARGLRLGPDRLLEEVDLSVPAARRNVTRLPGAGVAGVSEITRRLAAVAARTVAAGELPLVLGGDHTVAVGSIRGVRDGLRRLHRRTVPLFLLWLDAHPDANTRETSPSGNLHGMVLSGLLGYGPLAIQRPLPASRVTLAGARAFDSGEVAFLDARPEIARWDVAVLRDRRWRPLVDDLLDRVRRARGRLYVSVDLDVLDPRDAPGVAVPVPRGALPTPFLSLLRHLAAGGLLAGADVVELDPSADADGRTARLAARAVEALSAGAARRYRVRSPPRRSPAAGVPPATPASRARFRQRPATRFWPLPHRPIAKRQNARPNVNRTGVFLVYPWYTPVDSSALTPARARER